MTIDDLIEIVRNAEPWQREELRAALASEEPDPAVSAEVFFRNGEYYVRVDGLDRGPFGGNGRSSYDDAVSYARKARRGEV